MTLTLTSLSLNVGVQAASGAPQLTIAATISSTGSPLTRVLAEVGRFGGEMTWVELVKGEGNQWHVENDLHLNAASGTYLIQSIRGIDGAGLTTQLTFAELGKFHDTATFTNPHADNQPPQITRLTLGAPEGRGAGVYEIPMTLRVADGFSGIDHDAVITVALPDGRLIDRAVVLDTSGAWSGNLSLPFGSTPGIYTIAGIRTSDQAGNINLNTTSALMLANLPTSVQIRSSSDLAGPKLTGLIMSAAADGFRQPQIEIRLSAEDANGLGNAVLQFGDALGHTFDVAVTGAEGKSAVAVTPTVFNQPSSANNAEYQLKSITLEDTLGNVAIYKNLAQFQTSVWAGLSGGANTFSGHAGNETLDGGGGTDVMVYGEAHSNYRIMRTATGVKVTDKSGVEGTDLLSNFEQIRFKTPGDMPVSLEYNDLVQSLYVGYFGRAADYEGMTNFSAALARAGIHDLATLSALYSVDSGVRALIDAFGASDESKALYSGDTRAFVGAIYANLLGRPADKGGLDFWAGAIDGGLSRGAASLSIMAGALENTTAQGQLDSALIRNKVAAASNFTFAIGSSLQAASYAGHSAADTVRKLIAEVTAGTDLDAFQPVIELTLDGMAVASLVGVAPPPTH
jgi:hypothetical protein